jgi:hypothetical protein
MSWQSRLSGIGATEGWPAAADRTAASEGPEKPAAEPVALIKDQPLAPQVLGRLDTARAVLAALEDKAKGLALGSLLDKAGDGARLSVLEDELAPARIEVQRLQQAYVSACDMDRRAAAEIEIAELERQLERYQDWGAARVAAVADLERATELAVEAGRRYVAATSLLRDGLPGHPLPRGLILDRNGMEAGVDAVRHETDLIVTHVKNLVRMTIRHRRGEELQDD